MNKKTKRCSGLTNIVYKQQYEFYLKTVEYKNILKKTKEQKEENIESEPKNPNVPMDCPDHIYIKPQVCFTCF